MWYAPLYIYNSLCYILFSRFVDLKSVVCQSMCVCVCVCFLFITFSRISLVLSRRRIISLD